MSFEGIIAIINRHSGIYNQVINSWTRWEGEGGRSAAGINCVVGKRCHLQLRSEQELEAFSILLFSLRAEAPPPWPHGRAIAPKAALTANNNEELKKPPSSCSQLCATPPVCVIPHCADRRMDVAMGTPPAPGCDDAAGTDGPSSTWRALSAPSHLCSGLGASHPQPLKLNQDTRVQIALLALRGEISLSLQHRPNSFNILKRKIYPFPFHPLPNLVFLKS